MNRKHPFIVWEGRVTLVGERSGRYRIVSVEDWDFTLEELVMDALGNEAWVSLADSAHRKIIAFAFHQLGSKNHE